MDRNGSRRVFIVLGLYRPDPTLLERQLASIEAQTYRNFHLVLAADGPLDEQVRSLVSRFASPSVSLLEPRDRVGVHANFARGLRAALAMSHEETDLFAFCDQDDFWAPEKLARQVAAFDDPDVSLCHSDARIVGRDGALIAPSMFARESRHPSASFADLLVMNSITGMTAMFRRDVAVAAHNFPLAGSRYVLHDHWVALVASLFGDIRLIAEPLVDYTQHAANVRGATSWSRGGHRNVPLSHTRAYLRKAYREFLWRRRVFEALRRELAHVPAIHSHLSGGIARKLFDCGTSRLTGLAPTFALRLRGRRRQADQLWRLVLGKVLYCRKVRNRRFSARSSTPGSAAVSASGES